LCGQDGTINRISHLVSELNDERAQNPDIGELILLDRTRLDLSPSLTILGATLWSQLNTDDVEFLSKALKDFRRIEGLTPEAYNILHHADVEWLNTQVELIRVNEPGRQIIIFTHHAPVVGSTSDPRYAGSPSNSAFATDLIEKTCWGSPVKIWAFGHTHWSCDFVRNGVRVVSNQRGYSLTAADFNPSFTIQVKGSIIQRCIQTSQTLMRRTPWFKPHRAEVSNQSATSLPDY
jgi:hypothetical protein